MFSGFTKETSDFFWELAFNNERPWFREHREQYERCIGGPFKALGEETLGLMAERYPDLDWQIHISRIYRDARRLFGRGPVKDHLWFSIWAGDGHAQSPGFWFEISAARFEYGMGMYDLTPSQMDAFRRLLDANPARFERLAEPIERQGKFAVVGQEYKRPKAERDGLIGKWYNRRWVGLTHSEDFGGELLSPELPRILADNFAGLMPMYEYFLEFYRSVRDMH